MAIEHEISERYLDLPSSEFAEILRIATEEKDVISLGPGEPDFTTPKHIIEFAKKKLDEGYTHYTPIGGRSDTKEAIAKKLKRDNKIDVDPEKQIVVTCGAKESILLTLMSLIDPGESVLIPNPGYLAYIPMVESLNGVPLSVQLKEEEKFEYDLDRVKEIMHPKKTLALILNTPSNPTGTVFSKKKLEEIADFAVEHDLIIITDEAYEKLVYDDAKHISIGNFNGMEDRVISIFSFSKSYAMPGFRIGFAAGSEDIIQAMVRLKLGTTLSTPTISQLAAIEALEGDQSCVEDMRKEYDRRRKLIVKRIKEIPKISCLDPEGAFYAFPNVKSLGMKSTEVVDLFLKKAKVLTVPGTEFGKYGEGYIRLSYATAHEKIEEALNRIEKVVRKLG